MSYVLVFIGAVLACGGEPGWAIVFLILGIIAHVDET